MISKEEICYQISKTVCKVFKVDDTYSHTPKKISLNPEEARILISHGIDVYREEITHKDGTKFHRLFFYTTLENLIKASK
jgi:hypothetical protein